MGPATTTAAAHCLVEGAITPVDRSGVTPAINFRVALPEVWSGRAMQFGGGGMNGFMPTWPAPRGSNKARVRCQGFATYASDSGHEGAPGGRGVRRRTTGR